MLRAYLFDQRHGKKIDDWADVLKGLEESQVLWVDLLEPTAEEEQEVEASFGLEKLETGSLREGGVRPGVDQGREYLRVTALPVRDSEADALETVALDCFVGKNWVRPLTPRNSRRWRISASWRKEQARSGSSMHCRFSLSS